MSLSLIFNGYILHKFYTLKISHVKWFSEKNIKLFSLMIINLIPDFLHVIFNH